MAVDEERALDRWWLGDPSERFWLEVGDRGADLGADLNAPAANEVGGRFWSYDLLEEVEVGDVVLHNDRSEHAIHGWARHLCARAEHPAAPTSREARSASGSATVASAVGVGADPL